MFVGKEDVVVFVGERVSSCLLGERVSSCLLGERVLSCLLGGWKRDWRVFSFSAVLEQSQSYLSSGSRASWCRLVESQLNVRVRRVWWGCCFVLVLCKVSQVLSICPRYYVGCSAVLPSYPQVWRHWIVSL